MYAVNESLPDSETSAERRVQISYVAPLRSGAGVDTNRSHRRPVAIATVDEAGRGDEQHWEHHCAEPTLLVGRLDG